MLLVHPSVKPATLTYRQHCLVCVCVCVCVCVEALVDKFFEPVTVSDVPVETRLS